MSAMTTDRCECPYPDPMTYGGPNPECPRHGDPDAIIASGRYVDRRGRRWHLCMHGSPFCGMWHQGHPSAGITPDQIRARIVRDQHRDRCPGLAECETHPVPQVGKWNGHWWFGSGWDTHRYATFAEAIAAAHQMTGDER